MANIQIGEGLANYGYIGDFYNFELLGVSGMSSTGALITDSNNARIILTGTKLEFSDDDQGRLIGGTITGLEFIGGSDEELLTFTGGKFKATAIAKLLQDQPNLENLMTLLTSGNDKFFGTTEGSDFSFGQNAGNDVITAGADGSYMAGSEGKDT